MELLLDFANMTERAVGAKGVSPERLKVKTNEAIKALKTLLANPHGWPLGWLDLYARNSDVDAVNDAIDYTGDCDTLITIGMGGSGLGTRAVAAMFGKCVGPGEFTSVDGSRLIVLDNLDEDRTRRVAEECAGRKIALNPVSKSGNTLEMVANLTVLLGKLGADTKCVVTTGDVNSPLGVFAQKTKSPVLPVADDIGGRFTVLSAVSFFPLAFAGVDVMQMWVGAVDAHEEYTRKAAANPAVRLAAYLHEMYTAKGISQMVFMPYDERLYEFGRWWVQLFAESLGKRKLLNGRTRATGFTPFCALGPSDQHSILQLLLEGPNDKVINIVELDEPEKVAMRFGKMPPGLEEFSYLKGKCIHDIVRAELYGTQGSLKNQGRPFFTSNMHRIDPYAIGQLIYFYEVVVGLLGVMFNINAFDQPAVVESKEITRKQLSCIGGTDI